MIGKQELMLQQVNKYIKIAGEFFQENLQQIKTNISSKDKHWINPKDIIAGDVVSGPTWKVSTTNAEHVQPYLDSIAYRFSTNNTSIVFTGDTQPCDSVINLSKNADIMVCMCWDDQESMNKDKESSGQCSAEGAAEMAEKAGVKKLILSHMGKHISTHGVLEKALGNAAKKYSRRNCFCRRINENIILRFNFKSQIVDC